MNKFNSFTFTCLPIRTENIDTDQIIPARFLKTTKREGLGKFLFYNWRFDEKGKPKTSDFNYLNYQSVRILIAGNNFGCGSSREHAVWALTDYGFKAIISSSYGDIFYSNCLKNGLLPIVLKPKELEKLFQIIEKDPKTEVTVDLDKQTVSFHNSPQSPSYLKRRLTLKVPLEGLGGVTTFHFPIDSFRKSCLLKGVDELGYIMSFEKKIVSYEIKHKSFVTR